MKETFFNNITRTRWTCPVEKSVGILFYVALKLSSFVANYFIFFKKFFLELLTNGKPKFRKK